MNRAAASRLRRRLLFVGSVAILTALLLASGIFTLISPTRLPQQTAINLTVGSTGILLAAAISYILYKPAKGAPKATAFANLMFWLLMPLLLILIGIMWWVLVSSA